MGVSVAPTLQQQKCGQFCHLQFCECPRLNRRFRRLEASSSIPPRSWWRHAATKQPVLPDQFSKSDSLDLEVLGNHRPRLVMLLCVPAQLLLQRSILNTWWELSQWGPTWTRAWGHLQDCDDTTKRGHGSPSPLQSSGLGRRLSQLTCTFLLNFCTMNVCIFFHVLSFQSQLALRGCVQCPFPTVKILPLPGVSCVPCQCFPPTSHGPFAGWCV